MLHILLSFCLSFLFFISLTSAFNDMPPMDPSISTQSPHSTHNSDSCVGQCAFSFIDQMSSQLGSERSAGLLNLNYNDFLAAFANATFFETFCKLYHEFNYCYTKCPHGFMQELLARSAEIVDHFCVWNYKAIMEHFGCLAGLDRDLSQKCLKSCSRHHDAVTSMMENFKHLALNGDPTESERYLAESCEYVTCTLHCDVPAIYHLCGLDTAELVVNLTRKSFESMQRMALDTGALRTWPNVCADIHNYTVPKAPAKKEKASGSNRTTTEAGNNNNSRQRQQAWQLTERSGIKMEVIQDSDDGRPPNSMTTSAANERAAETTKEKANSGVVDGRKWTAGNGILSTTVLTLLTFLLF